MNILVTSDTYLPTHGGAEIHVHKLIERLRERGHTVVLLTNELKSSEGDQGVVRIAWNKFTIHRLFMKLWTLVSGVDLIHAHYSYRLAALSCIVGRLRGVPVIITLHGLGTLPMAGARLLPRIADTVYRTIAYTLCTHVISTSEDLEKFALPYAPKEKITVIPNGYDERVFNNEVIAPKELVDRYAGKKLLMTIRRLVPKNGVHYLIEAMPEIITAIPNILYLVVGYGRLEEHIRARIKALKIEDHIEMLGEMQHSTTPGYLALVDAVAFPSTAESTSIACAESMAIGVPVVASRVGGLIELLGTSSERGWHVQLVDNEASDYDAPLTLSKERYHALAQTVVSAIQNPDPQKVQEAQRWAEAHLSWRAIIAETESVYERVCKKKS